MKDGPTASVKNRMSAGSCNNCHNREDKEVIEIDLNSCSFRLCWGCAMILKERLKSILKVEKIR